MRTKLYFFAPLIALVLFATAFVFWNAHHRRVLAERAAAAQVERETARAAAEAARREAFAEALAAQEKRAAERAAREARRQADEAARREALDTRDALATRVAIAQRELNALDTAIENERDAVARLERDAAALAAEQTALTELAQKARANQAALTTLLSQPAPAPAATQR